MISGVISLSGSSSCGGCVTPERQVPGTTMRPRCYSTWDHGQALTSQERPCRPTDPAHRLFARRPSPPNREDTALRRAGGAIGVDTRALEDV